MCDGEYSIYGIQFFDNKDCILLLEWYSVDGNFHSDFFCTRQSAGNHTDVSYVHIWDNPEEGLRDFLSHCPLHNINVKRVDYFQRGL